MVAEPETVVRRFESYLRDAGEDLEVGRWSVLGGGRSSHMLGMELRGRRGTLDVVVAQESEAGPLKGIVELTRQFELLRALDGTAVKAPRALWHSDDPEILGLPFIVTEFAEGRVADPWRPEGRAFLARARTNPAFLDSVARELAAIHAVDVTALPSSVDPGEEPARRELARWSAPRRRSAFRDDPLLAYAEHWLDRHMPEGEERALCHGDYRVGNLMVDDDGVVAVLDWELAEVGSAALDVALFESPVMLVDGHFDGLWEPGDFVERYERAGGRRLAPELREYYRRLVSYKVVSLWVNGSLADTLRGLRAGFSVLGTRRGLADAFGLPRPGRSGTPSPPVRAAQVLAELVRSEVRPAVDDPVALAELDLALASLRSLARVDDGADGAAFERDVTALLGEGSEEPVAARLSRAIPEAWGSPELDALVGRASELSLGMWP